MTSSLPGCGLPPVYWFCVGLKRPLLTFAKIDHSKRCVFHNGRLQPTNIAAAKGASSLLSLGYGYTKTSGCNGGLSTCNNGNVMSQTITPPGSWSASQTYGYDALNRLASASEAGDYGWSENFGYDARGN